MAAYLAPDPATGDLLVECALCDHTQAFRPARPGDYTDIRAAASAAAAAHTATHTQPIEPATHRGGTGSR